MSCDSSPSNKVNITVEQNASYILSLDLRQDDGVTPVNITGWNLTGSIRESYDSVLPTTFFTMSVLDVVSGSISARLSAEQTWGLSGSEGYYYDIIANNTGSAPLDTFRLLYGRVKINRGVTEP